MPPVSPRDLPRTARRDDHVSTASLPPDRAATGSGSRVRTVGLLFLLSTNFVWGMVLTLFVT